MRPIHAIGFLHLYILIQHVIIIIIIIIIMIAWDSVQITGHNCGLEKLYNNNNNNNNNSNNK